MPEILIVDDEADIRTLISDVLQDEGFTTRAVGDSDACATALREKRPDLLLLDVWLQGSARDGLQILKDVRRDAPDLPVVMISGHGTIEMAVAAIRDGAYEFIEKPFKIDRLLLVVGRAIEAAALRRENATLRWRANAVEDFDGSSPAIQKLRSAVEKSAPTNSRLMIRGPIGAGKAVACRLAHRLSHRANGPIVICPLGGAAPADVERDLFGVADGPAGSQPGAFERADGGTLVLDAIEDAPPAAQAGLVRALHENAVRRVGSDEAVAVDVRVMTCAGDRVEGAIAAGSLREDLFYRLNVVSLDVPGLAERSPDVPVLAEKFLVAAALESGGRPKRFAADALAALQAYPWPGNVRQLKNVVDWLTTMSQASGDDIIRAEALPPELSERAPTILRGDWSAEVMDMPLRDAREAFERAYLETQIFRFRGNISRTAQHVGMERSALHRKLKSLGVGGAGGEA
ncbi:MAG: sigma-54 dependent transcriptional regulator [Pseudomonadota bacterium]